MADTSGGPGHAPTAHPAGAHTDPYERKGRGLPGQVPHRVPRRARCRDRGGIAIPVRSASPLGRVQGRGVALGQTSAPADNPDGRRARTSRSCSRRAGRRQPRPPRRLRAPQQRIRPRSTTATSSRSRSNTCMHLGCPVVSTRRRLQLPLPRRRLRLAGPGHRGPAAPPARPLRVQDRSRRGDLSWGASSRRRTPSGSVGRLTDVWNPPGQPSTGLLSYLYPPPPRR